ncbi:MAG: hypothetical protein R6U66_08795, partial [Bacteroidales bacterium]
HEALNELYQFNLDRIYRTDEATRHYTQIDRAMVFLFDFLWDLSETESFRKIRHKKALRFRKALGWKMGLEPTTLPIPSGCS